MSHLDPAPAQYSQNVYQLQLLYAFNCINALQNCVRRVAIIEPIENGCNLHCVGVYNQCVPFAPC